MKTEFMRTRNDEKAITKARKDEDTKEEKAFLNNVALFRAFVMSSWASILSSVFFVSWFFHEQILVRFEAGKDRGTRARGYQFFLVLLTENVKQLQAT